MSEELDYEVWVREDGAIVLDDEVEGRGFVAKVGLDRMMAEELIAQSLYGHPQASAALWELAETCGDEVGTVQAREIADALGFMPYEPGLARHLWMREQRIYDPHDCLATQVPEYDEVRALEDSGQITFGSHDDRLVANVGGSEVMLGDPTEQVITALEAYAARDPRTFEKTVAWMQEAAAALGDDHAPAETPGRGVEGIGAPEEREGI